MEFAECYAIVHYRFALRIGVRKDVSGVKQFVMSQPA